MQIDYLQKLEKHFARRYRLEFDNYLFQRYTSKTFGLLFRMNTTGTSNNYSSARLNARSVKYKYYFLREGGGGEPGAGMTTEL